MHTNDAVAAHILSLEEAALDEWIQGNPSGFLQIYAEDYSYFDPFVEKRVDGFQAIKQLYESLRGQISADRYEMLNPTVQTHGDTAVLSFNYRAYCADGVQEWNCTEVYRLQADNAWKIIHTHWSLTKPSV
ncbi:MAG: nuclear transport factor 2 family protein [Prevotellaceae bacterium]|jgi:ketosteroid isomerase-like protein|nr:nuclear transport factor 2 family protein [Prevotellaceae bacterium]